MFAELNYVFANLQVFITIFISLDPLMCLAVSIPVLLIMNDSIRFLDFIFHVALGLNAPAGISLYERSSCTGDWSKTNWDKSPLSPPLHRFSLTMQGISYCLDTFHTASCSATIQQKKTEPS